jgi:hypothetical protein
VTLSAEFGHEVAADESASASDDREFSRYCHTASRWENRKL